MTGGALVAIRAGAQGNARHPGDRRLGATGFAEPVVVNEGSEHGVVDTTAPDLLLKDRDEVVSGMMSISRVAGTGACCGMAANAPMMT